MTRNQAIDYVYRIYYSIGYDYFKMLHNEYDIPPLVIGDDNGEVEALVRVMYDPNNKSIFIKKTVVNIDAIISHVVHYMKNPSKRFMQLYITACILHEINHIHKFYTVIKTGISIPNSDIFYDTVENILFSEYEEEVADNLALSHMLNIYTNKHDQKIIKLIIGIYEMNKDGIGRKEYFDYYDEEINPVIKNIEYERNLSYKERLKIYNNFDASKYTLKGDTFVDDNGHIKLRPKYPGGAL